MITIKKGEYKDGIYLKVDEKGTKGINGFLLLIDKDDYKNLENSLQGLVKIFEKKINNIISRGEIAGV